jgi:catalase
MKKTTLATLTVFLVGGLCSIPYFMNSTTQRKVASVNDYNKNVAILNSIPLIKGVESRRFNEPEISQTLIEIFGKIADEAANQDGSLNRGTHAKGRCFNGNFKVYSHDELQSQFHYEDHLISRLKQGLFAIDGDMKAELRFANAKGSKNKDNTPDVKAFSFSIEGPEQFKNYRGNHRQDFMMNSSPMFAVTNIKEFVELMKTARLAGGDFDYAPNPFYLKSTLRAKKLLEEYERSDTKSYTTEEYWTNLSYSHGLKNDGSPLEIVKFKTTPCNGSGIQHESSANKSDNYLQEDIVKRAMNGEVCFYVQAQLFDLAKIKNTLGGKNSKWTTVDWVENGGELWDETALPYYNVAKVEIKKAVDENSNPVSSEVSCDGMFISTRLHSTPSNQPLGSIARVRSLVEENSRARRMKEL